MYSAAGLCLQETSTLGPFTALMSRPYIDNVVISPHIYGPSIAKITNFQGAAFYDAINSK